MANRIRLDTTDPSLKEKIDVEFDDDKIENVYWYIKFNIPLDENTVSHKTMSVMDSKGYKMKTDILYYQSSNTIVITPIESYLENIYYILNISKNVKSLSGKSIKINTHILFKLKDCQILNYKILDDTVKIPKQVERPINYHELMMEAYPRAVIKNMYIKRLVNPYRGKKYDLEVKGVDEGKAFLGSIDLYLTETADEENEEALKDIEDIEVGKSDNIKEGKTDSPIKEIDPSKKLEYADVNSNMLLCLLGFLFFIISFFIGISYIIAIASILCGIGIIHLSRQLIKQNIGFTIYYNYGVKKYNKGEYSKALKGLEKALAKSPEDENLLYIIAKVQRKITENEEELDKV